MLNQIVRQTWAICDEASYAQKSEFYLLLGNGELIRVGGGTTPLIDTVSPPKTWFVPGLPEMPLYVDRPQESGAIVIDPLVAEKLLAFTNFMYGESRPC